MLVPQEYVGDVIALCHGEARHPATWCISAGQVVLTYELPLNEVVLDFRPAEVGVTRLRVVRL